MALHDVQRFINCSQGILDQIELKKWSWFLAYLLSGSMRCCIKPRHILSYGEHWRILPILLTVRAGPASAGSFSHCRWKSILEIIPTIRAKYNAQFRENVTFGGAQFLLWWTRRAPLLKNKPGMESATSLPFYVQLGILLKGLGQSCSCSKNLRRWYMTETKICMGTYEPVRDRRSSKLVPSEERTRIFRWEQFFKAFMFLLLPFSLLSCFFIVV